MKNSAINIRKAKAEDLAGIVALLAHDPLGSQREDPTLPLADAYLDAFTAIISDSNQFLLVAVDGDVVVGTMQLTFIPGISRLGSWRGQIEAVRVAESHRSRGLGEQLIESALQQFKERKCRLVQLTTDKSRSDAYRFYEKLGFKATHEGFKRSLTAD